MEPVEQYVSVVLFIMLYKLFVTFESAGEVVECDNSNESYGAILSTNSVYYAALG